MSAPIALPSELVISMKYAGLAIYQGTRAMLEAEGIIPANTKWPEGYDNVRWDDGKYCYWMRRERPEGAKGPRKLFVTVDWWSVHQQLIAENYVNRELMRKKQELTEYAYRNSAAGQAEWRREFNSYALACADEKFQAFKELVPGLVKPKRARRSKSTHLPQGAVA